MENNNREIKNLTQKALFERAKKLLNDYYINADKIITSYAGVEVDKRLIFAIELSNLIENSEKSYRSINDLIEFIEKH